MHLTLETQPKIISKCSLALAGHVMRHNKVENRVSLWKPDAIRTPDRPSTTLSMILDEDTGLEGEEL